jgi:DHA1 family multidrug resistance protein-like MFS transporter
MGALKKRSHWILPVTSAITFLGFLDTHLLIPVIAIYASSVGASMGMAGFIVGLYSIINTPANIVFGRLIDRVGYKSPLLGGLIGNVFSMVLYAFTRSPLHLALVRILHGASGALVAPSTMLIIANYAVSERRGRSMSFYGMALASASLIGYPLSGFIADRLGFNALFFFGASVVGIGILLSLMLPGSSRKKVNNGRPAKSESLQKIWSLLTRKGLMPSYAAIFAQYFTFGGVVTLLPIHLERLGMGAFEVGMLLAAFSAMFVVTQFPSGAISDRVGRLPPIVMGLLCVILSLIVLPLLFSFSLLAVSMALYGAGYGFLFPSISALVTDHTNMEERGLATGLFHALLTAGVAIGAPLMGWVGSIVGTGTGLLITPIPVFFTLVIALAFLRRV